MPLRSSLVGTRCEPALTEVDPRWSMAFAAALGDLRPCFMDTRDAARFMAHPLFPVCFEWPVVLELGRKAATSGLDRTEALRGVHATHEVAISRPIRPPQRLTTRAEVVAVERRKSGAYQMIRLDTTDDAGAPVCSSWYGSLYRGVEVDGPDRRLASAPQRPALKHAPSQPRLQETVHIGGGLAHIYTECARIYNPIHTDIAVAQAAGLPGLILHGTATLALAVSRVIAAEAAGDPTQVASVYGEFRAMVALPSDITVRIFAREASEGADAARFDVLNDRGEAAVANGRIRLGA
jgi:acyl dehydratase